MSTQKVVTIDDHVKEFVTELINIENEMDLLKEEKKVLFEKYETILEVSTLKKAISIQRAEGKVKNKGAYDQYRDILDKV